MLFQLGQLYVNAALSFLVIAVALILCICAVLFVSGESND